MNHRSLLCLSALLSGCANGGFTRHSTTFTDMDRVLIGKQQTVYARMSQADAICTFEVQSLSLPENENYSLGDDVELEDVDEYTDELLIMNGDILRQGGLDDLDDVNQWTFPGLQAARFVDSRPLVLLDQEEGCVARYLRRETFSLPDAACEAGALVSASASSAYVLGDGNITEVFSGETFAEDLNPRKLHAASEMGGGMVFTSSGGELHALSADGDHLWSTAIEGELITLDSDGKNVFVYSQRDRDGFLSAFDADGRELAHREVSRSGHTLSAVNGWVVLAYENKTQSFRFTGD